MRKGDTGHKIRNTKSLSENKQGDPTSLDRRRMSVLDIVVKRIKLQDELFRATDYVCKYDIWRECCFLSSLNITGSAKADAIIVASVFALYCSTNTVKDYGEQFSS